MRDRRPSAPRQTRAGPIGLVLLLSVLIGCGWWLWAEGDRGSGQAAGKEVAVAKIAVGPIIRRVERLRGLRFRRPLKITFASRSEASALYRSVGEREYGRRERLIDEEELKLLGLLAPSLNLEGVFRTIAEDELLGFYVPQSKRLVVIRGETGSRALQEITLAHELTHALEDQHFGIELAGGFSDDRAVATHALFEGTATALMFDYAERYLDLEDLAGIFDDVAGTDVELPPFVERALLFPYEQGAEFVAAFRERGSWRAVDQVLRLRHPRSTEQVMHPEQYAIDERPVDVDAPDIRPHLGGDWHRLDTTSIGEFDLDSLFALVGKTKGSEPAKGWDGGRFELWRRNGTATGCEAPCIAADVAVLRVAWDTTSDTRQAANAFKRVFERGLKGKRLSDLRGVRLWSSRGGTIGMVGHRLETVVVFAPTPAIARSLLRAS